MFIRNVWSLIAFAVVLGACSSSEVVDHTSMVVSPTTTSLQTASTTTTSTTSPTLAPSPLPLAADWVIGSDRGVFIVPSSDSGAVVQLWDQPTSGAFMVGDDLVVAQGTTVSHVYPRLAEGPIIVFDSTGSRTLPMDDEQMVLFDADTVDGRPLALVTTRTRSGLDEADERLLLIDLITGERTDLGSVGGLESGVAQGRFADQWIALLTFSESRQQVMLRSLTGTEGWSQRLGSETHQALTAKDSELILLQPGFSDPGFTPTVTMDRYELEDGSNLGTTTITLRSVDNLKIEGGFCFTAEWVEEELICDQTYGGPLRINASGTVDVLGDFEQGVVTRPRVGS